MYKLWNKRAKRYLEKDEYYGLALDQFGNVIQFEAANTMGIPWLEAEDVSNEYRVDFIAESLEDDKMEQKPEKYTLKEFIIDPVVECIIGYWRGTKELCGWWKCYHCEELYSPRVKKFRVSLFFDHYSCSNCKDKKFIK